MDRLVVKARRNIKSKKQINLIDKPLHVSVSVCVCVGMFVFGPIVRQCNFILSFENIVKH